MNKVIGGTHIKRGQASIEPHADDIFDKIINLLFIRRSNKRFIVRSDYEPVFHSDGTISLKRCIQKPHIKVSYRQVAQSVAIEINIEVTNLFIDYAGVEGKRDEADSRLDAFDGDPVETCIIQMGYRGQFPDWTAPERKNNIDQYYDLNNNGLTTEAEVGRGRQILVQILTAYTTSMPPDKVTYFQGIVGTVESGFRWNHTEGDLTKNYGDTDYESSFPDPLSEINLVLFQFITRRFVKPSVLHRVEEVKTEAKVRDTTYIEGEAIGEPPGAADEEAADVTPKVTQKIMIYGLKDYEKSRGVAEKPLTTFREFEDASMVPENDTTWTELKLNDKGIMKVEDALQFGIPCLTTVRLRKAVRSVLERYDMSEDDLKEMAWITQTPFDGSQNTVGAQLREIQQHYPFLRWFVLRDGSYFVYHEDDTEDDLFDDPIIKDKQRSDLVMLPAIYDITMAGTRKIRCPFVSFISPMTTVMFNSRYILESLTGFYHHPKAGLNAYLVILASIEFDTTGDANMMELTCVDIKEDQSPTIDPETGEVSITDSQGLVVGAVEPKPKAWVEAELIAGEYPENRGVTRWAEIAGSFLLPNAADIDWPDGQPDMVKMFTDLKEWNSGGVWNDGRMENDSGYSPENTPAGRFPFNIPWLYKGDKVKYRKPYLPSYGEAP
jgi:hypothetical protein